MAIPELKDYVIVDIETTGLDRSDEILEIGALRVCNHVITKSFDVLCKPSKHIPVEVSNVHHIYDDTVKDCYKIDVGISAFAKFVNADDILMGHNISCFDIKYLNRAAEEHLQVKFCNKIIDTLYISRHEMKFLGSHSLQGLSAYYGVDYSKAHRAIEDCFINYQIYEKMLHDNFENMERICPVCGNILKLRLGKYGWFYSCSKYPTCNYSESFNAVKSKP